jgi:hypothetical protein
MKSQRRAPIKSVTFYWIADWDWTSRLITLHYDGLALDLDIMLREYYNYEHSQLVTHHSWWKMGDQIRLSLKVGNQNFAGTFVFPELKTEIPIYYKNLVSSC